MLIGLNGFKESGKDTVGKYLVDNYGFERKAFADKLKESVAALFEISIEQIDAWKLDEDVKVCIERNSEVRGINSLFVNTLNIKKTTFRSILQRYGTESHREVFDYDFWLNQLLPDPCDFVNDHINAIYMHFDIDKIVITDARFENELIRIKELDGINIRIKRDTNSNETHASEVTPDPKLIDYIIDNNVSFADLYKQVDSIMFDLDTSNR